MLNLSILLIQIAVILATCRVVGWLFKRFRQQQVIGEMAAGIILGPSLLGWLAPGLFAALFPSSTLDFISALSQVGLIVFMFLAGLEINPETIRKLGRPTVAVGGMSFVFPFFLAVLLSVVLYPRLSAPSVPFLNFALLMGVAMSITAFPVLARILTDSGIIGSSVGTVAMASAAAGDVVAWIILAGVVLLAGGNSKTLPLWAILSGFVIFMLFMFLFGRRCLERIGVNKNLNGNITQSQLALILLLVLVSGLVTEILGIHPLFGAFFLGTVMPRDFSFVEELRKKLEDIVVVLLVPLYFAFTGLRTSLGLISGLDSLVYLALILIVAVVGKFGGAFLASKMSGMSWREASSVGVLMNTRGMIELVVLNIGLDIGAISPLVFALMVLMAIITTFMTSPILEFTYPRSLGDSKQDHGHGTPPRDSELRL